LRFQKEVHLPIAIFVNSMGLGFLFQNECISPSVTKEMRPLDSLFLKILLPLQLLALYQVTRASKRHDDDCMTNASTVSGNNFYVFLYRVLMEFWSFRFG